MKLDVFRQTLAGLSLRPVLLVAGPGPYPRKLIIEALKKRGAQEHGEGFACQTVYANSRTARQVVTECRAGEFFVTTKLIVLHDIERYNKDDLGVLTAYVRAPDPAVSLVMTAETLDGRTALAKAIGKIKGGRIDLKPMYENEMPPWIDALAKRQGKRVSRTARAMLAELCGTNLSALATEVEKLDLFTGERDTIEEADVAAVAGRARNETYYRLRDAVLERSTGGALEIWQTLVADGESAYALLGRLRATLRELINAKELADSGAGMSEIGRALGIPSWRQRELGAVLAKTGLRQVLRNLVLLFDADLDLRTSRLTEQQVAERLIVLLCAA